MERPFHSIYSHGFIRTAVCVPRLRVADPDYNAEQTIRLAEQASAMSAAVTVFPELGLSAYANDDLFHQDALLDSAMEAVSRVAAASRDLTPVLVVGAPLRFDAALFNCAVVIYRGNILGIVPKSYLPNYAEFYEKRQFTRAAAALRGEVRFLNATVPFGSDLIFETPSLEHFALHVELCEDLWVPIPPSTYAALGGACVLANLSASNSTIGKAEYRRGLCALQSGKCVAAYLYAGAGPGESTTDLAWDGHGMIWENGRLLAETERFSPEGQMMLADVDLELLAQNRMRLTSFHDAAGDHRDRLQTLRRIAFDFEIPQGDIPLRRPVERFPYVPSDPATLDSRCQEACNIQVHGLMQRLQSTGIDRIVIGVSGGLDSTQALLVAARTMDKLGLSREHILAYTMPGFATSDRTLANARALMQAVGVTAGEIDIRPAAMQTFRDIGHPFADDEPVYDVTFENVQAGTRTSHLFRLANLHGGLVLGTGDLSELALGWTTYGVGDHMSHYNVNASVPKTLVQHLIRWTMEAGAFDDRTAGVLQSVLDTEISPELVPQESGNADEPHQRTEEVVGPFDLQDFNLYYVTRYGFRPAKVAFLSHHAWGSAPENREDAEADGLPAHTYALAEIKHWLGVFLYRFFKTSQFKRSAMPNGPKVGSGGSLSPRGDWRAPSDSEADVWIEALHRDVPDR